MFSNQNNFPTENENSPAFQLYRCLYRELLRNCKSFKPLSECEATKMLIKECGEEISKMVT